MDESLEQICFRVIDFLAESQVPEEHLQPLRKVAHDDPEEVLERAEEIGYCMAYMDHERLVRLLASGWKTFCQSKLILRKKAFKFCARLEADTKADSYELNESKRKREDIDQKCAIANLKVHRMHVLEASYYEQKTTFRTGENTSGEEHTENENVSHE